MYRRWFYFVTFIVVIFLLLSGYSYWGRTYVYSDGSDETSLPGFGRFYGSSEDKYVLTDVDNGQEIWVQPEDVENYDADKYLRTFIPRQGFLGYSVGHFERWEDVENSDDKYLLIRDSNDEAISKYRVIFERMKVNNKSFWTILEVESVNFVSRYRKMEAITERVPFGDLSFEKVERLFKKGDVVAVIPLRTDDSLNVTDLDNNIFLESVLIRRYFGMMELKLVL